MTHYRRLRANQIGHYFLLANGQRRYRGHFQYRDDIWHRVYREYNDVYPGGGLA